MPKPAHGRRAGWRGDRHQYGLVRQKISEQRLFRPALMKTPDQGARLIEAVVNAVRWPSRSRRVGLGTTTCLNGAQIRCAAEEAGITILITITAHTLPGSIRVPPIGLPIARRSSSARSVFRLSPMVTFQHRCRGVRRLAQSAATVVMIGRVPKANHGCCTVGP